MRRPGIASVAALAAAAADVIGSVWRGELTVWLPIPCLPSGSNLDYEISLFAGLGKVPGLDPSPTKSYSIGGGC